MFLDYSSGSVIYTYINIHIHHIYIYIYSVSTLNLFCFFSHLAVPESRDTPESSTTFPLASLARPRPRLLKEFLMSGKLPLGGCPSVFLLVHGETAGLLSQEKKGKSWQVAKHPRFILQDFM